MHSDAHSVHTQCLKHLEQRAARVDVSVKSRRSEQRVEMGLSLAEQLAEINNVQPQGELDPEADDDPLQPPRVVDAGEGRAHYADVGCVQRPLLWRKRSLKHFCSASSLRTASHLLDDPRYAGKATSRRALLEDDWPEDDDASEPVDDDEDDSDGDGSGVEDDASADEQNAAFDGAEQSGSEESDDAEDDGEPSSAPPAAPTATGKGAFADDERAMLQSLKQAASADVEKGRDVRKQLVRIAAVCSYRRR
jgi:protein AATF/BFR2